METKKEFEKYMKEVVKRECDDNHLDVDERVYVVKTHKKFNPEFKLGLDGDVDYDFVEVMEEYGF
jgi:hypothetical protein